MPKDLSLVQVVTLIPTAKIHQMDEFLEGIGATSISMRPYRNGAIAKKGENKTESSNGTIAKSKDQQEWLAENIKGKITLKDLMPSWIAASFRKDSIYGAISRAVDKKIIKKIGKGIYVPHPTGGGKK